MRTRIYPIPFAAILMMLTGCLSTRVAFEGPPGAVLFVDGKPHHLPSQVQLARPGEVGKPQRHEVTLAAPVERWVVEGEGDLDLMASSDIARVSLELHYPLFGEEELRQIWLLRRMASMVEEGGADAAERIIERLSKTDTNAEFLLGLKTEVI